MKYIKENKLGFCLSFLLAPTLAFSDKGDESSNSVAETAYAENLEKAQKRESEEIEEHLRDNNPSDDNFYRMIKDVGGFDAYIEMLETNDNAWIDLFHKKYNIKVKRGIFEEQSYETDSGMTENTRATVTRGVPCPNYLPSSVRNTVQYLTINGQVVQTAHIDDKGRPDWAMKMFGSYETPETGNRNDYCQRRVGNMGVPDDEGGHLIADVLGGYGGRENLAPQNGELNRGPWKEIERVVRKCSAAAERVEYRVDLKYDAQALRPSVWEAHIHLLPPVPPAAVHSDTSSRATAFSEPPNYGFHLNNTTPTAEDLHGVRKVLYQLEINNCGGITSPFPQHL